VVRLASVAAATFLVVVAGGLAGPDLLQQIEVATATANMQPSVSTSTYYPSCGAAHAEGVYSITQGKPGYRQELDADGDGLACEPYYVDGGVVRWFLRLFR
jgi:hypothetical protein